MKGNRDDMRFVDYYRVLGVERTASTADIKRAFYRLARKYHPDLHPDDEATLLKFQLITEAYHTLGNLDNRLRYSLLLERHEEVKSISQIDKVLHQKNKTVN